jgi:transcriptional regulator with XRE-family HTH domain
VIEGEEENMNSEKRAAALRFGANLRSLRLEKGISQQQLGKLAEINHDTIYRIETARRMPRLGTCLRLAGALGVQPADLLEGIEWSPSGAPSDGR